MSHQTNFHHLSLNFSRSPDQFHAAVLCLSSLTQVRHVSSSCELFGQSVLVLLGAGSSQAHHNCLCLRTAERWGEALSTGSVENLNQHPHVISPSYLPYIILTQYLNDASLRTDGRTLGVQLSVCLNDPLKWVSSLKNSRLPDLP